MNLLSKKAIALIGMPASGKSTLVGMLNGKTYDSDLEIEKFSKKAISEIFEKHGEDFFRKLETSTIRKLVKNENCVIALGGGAPVFNEKLITENCYVIYLKRNLQNVLSENIKGRPLSKTPEEFMQLYEERHEIYERMADLVIENDGDIKDAFRRLENAIANYKRS